MRKLLFLLLFPITFVCCYYDNEEDLYPSLTGPCDTTNVNYTSRIQPFLENNCYSCHSNANSSFGRGIKLEDLTSVRLQSAAIIAAITHTGPFPMPPTGRLNQCSIDIFIKWVDTGMPE